MGAEVTFDEHNWQFRAVGLFARCLAHIIVTLAKMRHPNAGPPFDYVDDLHDLSGAMAAREERGHF